jgi:hypothetical protein
MRMRMLIPAASLLTLLSGAPTFAAPVVVACGPRQHTIVREAYARGERLTRVECVGPTRGYVRYARPHRSWGKSALIIGGSASTGAGVGGLVGGKKGALVGAAVGGGVASLYEGAHRR